jgi:hemerythrin-like domain-containing protein
MSLFQLGMQAPAPDFADPLSLLEACHRRIEKHLAILGRSLEALEQGEATLAADARRAIRAALAFLDGPAATHALDEEASVFPRLHSPLVHELALEHREHEAIYLALRTVALRLADPASETTETLIEDFASHLRALVASYTEHMSREEEELFPLIRDLDGRELRAIGLEMRIRRSGKRD